MPRANINVDVAAILDVIAHDATGTGTMRRPVDTNPEHDKFCVLGGLAEAAGAPVGRAYRGYPDHHQAAAIKAKFGLSLNAEISREVAPFSFDLYGKTLKTMRLGKLLAWTNDRHRTVRERRAALKRLVVALFGKPKKVEVTA